MNGSCCAAFEFSWNNYHGESSPFHALAIDSQLLELMKPYLCAEMDAEMDSRQRRS